MIDEKLIAAHKVKLNAQLRDATVLLHSCCIVENINRNRAHCEEAIHDCNEGDACHRKHQQKHAQQGWCDD